MDLQVLREMVDPLREESDLDLRRPGIGVMTAVVGDRGGFVGHAFAEVRGDREVPVTLTGTRPGYQRSRAATSAGLGSALCDDAAGRFDVSFDLLDESLDARELLFAADAINEAHLDALVIEVAVEVEHVRLEQ